ncbi:MAG: hypothetical protein ABIE43_04045 [Patescibacteria group bacterium]
MKLIINKNQINTSPEQFLRKVGYAYHRDRRSGKDSFARRLGSGFYPKLHMYVMEQGDKTVFDLHLDQKQASYRGARMHNAEHDGEVVEREISRLRNMIIEEEAKPLSTEAVERGLASSSKSGDLLEKIGHGEVPQSMREVKKESWWGRIFG